MSDTAGIAVFVAMLVVLFVGGILGLLFYDK